MPPQGGRKHPHQDFIQIDTTNVLFIVGGAFAGLDHIIAARVGKRPLGFNNNLESRRESPEDPFADVRPEDLVKFGLIPEFIGRLPMISSVSPLDRDALIRILIEPRNALVKQFKKLFDLDGVELEFTDDAIEAIADLALLRGTGARGPAGHPRRGSAQRHVRRAQSRRRRPGDHHRRGRQGLGAPYSGAAREAGQAGAARKVSLILAHRSV